MTSHIPGSWLFFASRAEAGESGADMTCWYNAVRDGVTISLLLGIKICFLDVVLLVV